MNVPRIIAFAILTVLAACNPGQVSGTSEDIADLPDDTVEDVPSDLPSDCEDPLVDCTGHGICVDLMTEPNHCGECIHSCPMFEGGLAEGGGCVDGECLPHWKGCLEPEDSMTCADFCALDSRECRASACGDGAILWTPEPGGFDPPCTTTALVSAALIQAVSCETPINEALAEAELPDNVIAWCCCTVP